MAELVRAELLPRLLKRLKARCTNCPIEVTPVSETHYFVRLVQCQDCRRKIEAQKSLKSSSTLNKSRNMDRWKSNQNQISGSLIVEGGGFRAKDGGGLEWRVSANEGAGAGEYGTDSNQDITDRVATFEENTEWTAGSLKQSGTEGAHEQRFPNDWKPSIQGVLLSQATIKFIQGGGKCEVEGCQDKERTLESGRRARPILVQGIWRRVCARHFIEIEKAGLLERVTRHRGRRPNGVLLDTRRRIGV